LLRYEITFAAIRQSEINYVSGGVPTPIVDCKMHEGHRVEHWSKARDENGALDVGARLATTRRGSHPLSESVKEWRDGHAGEVPRDGDGVDFIWLARLLKRHRHMLIGSLALGLTLGIVLLVATPRYRATAAIYIDTKEQPLVGTTGGAVTLAPQSRARSKFWARPASPSA
jgi:hypothetical protein